MKKNPWKNFRSLVGRLFPQLLDIQRACITAYQRVTRGWADEDVWSIDYHLCEVVPEMLEQLKKDKNGVPQKYIMKIYEERGLDVRDSFCDIPEEIIEEADKRFTQSIDKMIAGFKAHKQISDWDFTPETHLELDRIYREGMQKFVDDFENLWW
ncbi:MAG: hypothetical protein WC511_02110 [Candidatus Pacearchaeota archaeon]